MIGRDFQEYGEGVIEFIRASDPVAYLKIIAPLLPRQLTVERTSQLADLPDSELERVEAMLRASSAKLVRQLDEHAEKRNGTRAGDRGLASRDRTEMSNNEG